MQLKLEQFTGPLDLLLSLLGDKKLEITEITLSDITEQYLGHIDALEETKAEELADFLVIAAKLLLLKSKNLLPQFAPEEDEEQSLEAQLRLYKAFVDASKKINTLWDSSSRSTFRTEPPRKAEGFVWPKNTTLDQMHQSMVKLVSRLKPLKALPQTRIDKAVSMKEKINKIRKILDKAKRMNFFEVIEQAENKTDVILSFLALLELVKQQTVALKQEEGFGDILIEKVG